MSPARKGTGGAGSAGAGGASSGGGPGGGASGGGGRGRRKAADAKKAAEMPIALAAEAVSAVEAAGGAPVTLPPPPPGHEAARLAAGELADPHALLGVHPGFVDGIAGITVRAWHPDAVAVECVPESAGDGARGAAPGAIPMHAEGRGLFGVFLPGETLPFRYRLRFRFAGGGGWERGDPYRFLPMIGEVDLHLFNEGTHRRLWEKLGAHPRTVDGVAGVAFAVWAPNARRVSVVGDFCGWDGRIFPMRRMGSSGVWELFIPGVEPNALYKFELVTREGLPRLKTDPFARKMQQAPATASIVMAEGTYEWGDGEWMRARPKRDLAREPMAIYEVHLGSWLRDPTPDGPPPCYRDVARRLADHAKALGFTHVEFLPLGEHPFYGSWGYQVTGFYAPTSRYGTPDDLRYLIDTLHQAGIGVILDWVPAHFPKDDYALRRFDGTALYEHEDPRLGEHPDWGTLIFNYSRHEVSNFLLANALYWLDEFHVDGLRVDAVASMLYLDYSREPGQWLRNRYGGRENLDAIAFLHRVTEAVRADYPGCAMIAEESTAWPSVSRAAREGGLGFHFKWNMGWMHDTLKYFSADPIYRKYAHDTLTFAMIYEYSERFIMPLSHDEVVHMKGSLLRKMPGDDWQRFANLRAMLAYMYTRPGKKLLFMGTELAPDAEWNHDRGLEWSLTEDPRRGAFCDFVRELGQLYRATPALWQLDHDPGGFRWVDVADKENSVVSYVRCDDEGPKLLVVLNLTPVPREHYRIGVPAARALTLLLSSDDQRWWGSGYAARHSPIPEPVPFHGFEHSAELTLPPLSAVVYAIEPPPPPALPPGDPAAEANVPS